MKRLVIDLKTGKTKTEVLPDPVVDLNQLKNNLLSDLVVKTSSYIFSYYPDIKQKSDLSDKEYFETYMKTTNIDEKQFRHALINSASKIFDKTSDFNTELQSLISQFPSPIANTNEWNFAIEQLFKIAIRVGFVQRCKNVHRQIEVQIKAASTVEELPNLNSINYPEYPL